MGLSETDNSLHDKGRGPLGGQKQIMEQFNMLVTVTFKTVKLLKSNRKPSYILAVSSCLDIYFKVTHQLEDVYR